MVARPVAEWNEPVSWLNRKIDQRKDDENRGKRGERCVVGLLQLFIFSLVRWGTYFKWVSEWHCPILGLRNVTSSSEWQKGEECRGLNCEGWGKDRDGWTSDSTWGENRRKEKNFRRRTLGGRTLELEERRSSGNGNDKRDGLYGREFINVLEEY